MARDFRRSWSPWAWGAGVLIFRAGAKNCRPARGRRERASASVTVTTPAKVQIVRSESATKMHGWTCDRTSSRCAPNRGEGVGCASCAREREYLSFLGTNPTCTPRHPTRTSCPLPATMVRKMRAPPPPCIKGVHLAGESVAVTLKAPSPHRTATAPGWPLVSLCMGAGHHQYVAWTPRGDRHACTP